MDAQLMKVMLDVDERHWWYRGRREIIRAELDRLPPPLGAAERSCPGRFQRARRYPGRYPAPPPRPWDGLLDQSAHTNPVFAALMAGEWRMGRGKAPLTGPASFMVAGRQ